MNKCAKYAAVLYFILVEFIYSFELTFIKIPDIIYNIFLFFSIGLFIISVALSRWTLREGMISCFMLLIALGVYFSSGETLFLMMVLSCILMHNISYSKSLVIIFWTRFVTFFVVILASLIGFIPINKMVVFKGTFGYYTGYGLGYQHPNNLAQAFLVLCLLYLSIKKSHLNSINYFIILFLDLIIYKITGAKTECVLLILACLGLYCIRFYNYKAILLKFVPIYLMTAIFLWVFIPFEYVNANGFLKNIAYFFNGLLNGRFSNASMLFEVNKLTLFGKIVNLDILKNIYGYNVVDNGYVFMLFNYGLIGFIAVIFWYIYAVNSLAKKEMYNYVVIIGIFLTLGLMENVIRAMFMNITIIFWYEFISPKQYSLTSKSVEEMETNLTKRRNKS